MYSSEKERFLWSRNVAEVIDDYIRCFPRRSPSGRKTMRVKYTKTHTLFLEKYEPKVSAEMQEGKERKLQVTYDISVVIFCKTLK